MNCRVCNSALDSSGYCSSCGFDEGLANEYYPTLQPIEGLSISGRRKKWEEKHAEQIECPTNLHPDMSAQSKLLSNSFNTRMSSNKVSVPATPPKSIKASAQAKCNDANADKAYKKALKKRTVANVIFVIIIAVNVLLAAVADVHHLSGDVSVDVSNIIIPALGLPSLGMFLLSDAKDHPTYLNLLAVFCIGIAAAFIPFWLMVIADSASLDFCKVDDASALFIIPLCYAIGIYFAGVVGGILSRRHVSSSKSDIFLARVMTIIIVTVYCIIIWKNGAKDDTVKMIFLISPAIAVTLLLFKRTPPILVLLAFLSIGFAALCCFGLLSMLLFESIGLADTAVAYAFMAVLGFSGLVFGFVLAQACTIDR